MVSLFPTVEAAVVDATAFGNTLDPIITNIVSPIVKLMFAVAVVAFVYGVVQMIWHKNDAEAHSRGRIAMVGGLIGMFIMVSAWGIINLVANTVKQF